MVERLCAGVLTWSNPINNQRSERGPERGCQEARLTSIMPWSLRRTMLLVFAGVLQVKYCRCLALRGNHVFSSSPRGLHGNALLEEKKTDSGKCCERSLHRESINFMKGVMDECTHMANFSGRFSVAVCLDWGKPALKTALNISIMEPCPKILTLLSSRGHQSHHRGPGKGGCLHSSHRSPQRAGHLARL